MGVNFMGLIEKFIFAADLHITDKTPRYRKDDYAQTSLRKLKWIVEKANELDAVLCVAGDFFDSPNVKYDITNRVIEILQFARYTPIVIAGQHDMINKVQSLENTPLYNLQIAGVIDLGGNGICSDNIFGQPFGTEIPDPPYKKNSIILIHRSITPGEPPWFLADAISAEKAIEEYEGFSLVVAGDYHKAFYYFKEKDGVHVINCGPMLRSEKDKRDTIPCVWLAVLGEGPPSIEKINIPIEPSEDVFDVEAIEYDEKNSITLDTNKLKELINKGVDVLDFDKVAYAVYANNSDNFSSITKQDVSDILKGVI